MNLQLELGSSPMSPLGVVSNGVAGLHSNPLWDWTILLLLLRQFSLNSKGLVRSLEYSDKDCKEYDVD